MNQSLWHIVDFLGPLFWLPFVGYGIYGLVWLYRLGAATSRLGRWIRVTLTISFVALFFAGMGGNLNGLGPFAMHLLAISACLWCRRRYEVDKADGRLRKASAPTIIERTVERMTEKPAMRSR